MASENSYQDFFSTIEAKEASTNEIFRKVCHASFGAVLRAFFLDRFRLLGSYSHLADVIDWFHVKFVPCLL